MAIGIVLGILIYYGAILGISILVKRRCNIPYDRKTLLSGLVFMIVAVVTWQVGDLEHIIPLDYGDFRD